LPSRAIKSSKLPSPRSFYWGFAAILTLRLQSWFNIEDTIFMESEILPQSKFIKNILYQVTNLRVQQKVKEVTRYLNKHDKILDIGAGNCVVCQVLTGKNFKVMPLDVRNLSFVDGVQPILYNGEELPFIAKEFDTAMLLTMLHHTKDPDNILREAKRVSRKVIIIEEIYTNKVQKFLTFFIDSLFNLQFVGHPHTNRTDEEWKQTFDRLGLEVMDVRYSRSLFVLKRATYFLGC